MEDDDNSSTTDSSSESTTTTTAAAAGILMLSLPDSFAEDEPHTDDKSSGDHDLFETPPEYALVGTSQEKTPVIYLNQIGDDDDEDRDFEGVGDIGDGSGVIVAVGGCGEEIDGALDLGRDSDLVVSQKELMEFRVSKRDLAGTAESSPPSKKLRVSEHDSGESEEELETERLSLSNLGSDSDHTLEIAGQDVKDDAKSVEESSGKKNVEDSGSDEDTQPITEESGGSSSEEFSYQEDCGEFDTGDSQVCRVLPLSFRPSVESSETRAEKGNKWSFLLDVLKLLKEKAGEECNEIEKCSFVEIARRRSMTFSRV